MDERMDERVRHVNKSTIVLTFSQQQVTIDIFY